MPKVESAGLWLVLGAIITERMGAPALTDSEIKALGSTTDAVLAKYVPTTFEYAPELALASTLAAVFLPRFLGAQKARQPGIQSIPEVEPVPAILDVEDMEDPESLLRRQEASWR